MKVFWFIVSAVFLVGGFALFAFAFTAEAIFGGGQPIDFPVEAVMFFGGIVAVAVAYMIPFHLLSAVD